MLIAAKKYSFDIEQVPIATVYLDGNVTTHYRPLKDSLTIIAQFAKYSAGALISFGIDQAGFYLCLSYLAPKLDLSAYSAAAADWLRVFICVLIARVVSASFNFIFNKNVVFKKQSGGKTLPSVLRYILLCVCVLITSSSLVRLFSYLASVAAPIVVTLIKIAVDAFLFILNYFIQKKWVYK